MNLPEAKHCKVSENENRKQKLEHVTAVGRREEGREVGRRREKEERRGGVRKREVVSVCSLDAYPPKRPLLRKLNVLLNPEVDFSLLSCVYVPQCVFVRRGVQITTNQLVNDHQINNPTSLALFPGLCPASHCLQYRKARA